MSEPEPMTYVGRDAHGCVLAVMVDAPEHKRDTALEVGKWMRSGLTIERASLQAVRAMTFGCPEERAKREKRQPQRAE